MISVHIGISRRVIVLGTVAFKFARWRDDRGARGRCCNLGEALRYRHTEADKGLVAKAVASVPVPRQGGSGRSGRRHAGDRHRVIIGTRCARPSRPTGLNAGGSWAGWLGFVSSPPGPSFGSGPLAVLRLRSPRILCRVAVRTGAGTGIRGVGRRSGLIARAHLVRLRSGGSAVIRLRATALRRCRSDKGEHHGSADK